MIRADDLSVVAWKCLHFGSSAEAEIALQELDPSFVVRRIDGAGLEENHDVLDALASALEFPDCFGRNWDAANECLRDIDEWLPAAGYVIMISNSETFWCNAPAVAATLAETWLFCAEAWAFRRISFHLLFSW